MQPVHALCAQLADRAQPGYSAPSQPMIVPSTPPLLPLVGEVVVEVPVGVGVDVAVGVVDGGELVTGGEVCVDFDGEAEDGWLAGLEDFPDFAVPAVPDAAPLPPALAPGLPWAFLCPDRLRCRRAG